MVLFGVAGLLVCFQNCSNGASFKAQGDLVAKGDAVTPLDGNTNAPNTGDGTPPSTNPPATSPPATSPPSTSHNNGSGDCDNSGSGSASSGSSGTGKAPTSNSLYVCVLRGNGSSQRIGLSENGLTAQVGTPRDVCMTENACLKIVSKKFDVKGAEKRGFCPDKNPHVIPMTDAEIEASLALSTLKAQFNK